MAINGDGFFVVQKPSSFIDNRPVFDGVNLYTRRGDFQTDKNGFLVNGAGYYLMGVPVDPTTGNPVGSVPEMLQFQNDFLPAQPTSQIEYRANLAKYPLTQAADINVPRSELLDTAAFGTNPLVAGAGVVAGADGATFIQQTISGGAITAYDPAGAAVNVQLRWAKTDGATYSMSPVLTAGSAFGALDAANLDETYGFSVTHSANPAVAISLTNAADADAGGSISQAEAIAAINAQLTAATSSVRVRDNAGRLEFYDNAGVTGAGQSITVNGFTNGGTTPTATTAFGFGASATVAGHTGADTWELFYLEDANATGADVAWRNAGVTYAFGDNGQMNPPTANVALNNVTVNGTALGNIALIHGTTGITEFSDPNGSVQVNQLQQNGFPAGDLQSVSINDKGRLTGTYSNGRTIDLASISLANFNGPEKLKRIDGGAFVATEESGPALFGAAGKIVAGALEGSNTDIGDEFTKLIVTQQAYSANTRIVTTSNEMVQDLLNMLR
jgi:flagellar hook protein FlgE